MLASGLVREGYVSEIFTSFQGEGLYAGRRHLFFRLAGCNIRCGYCDTPASLERTNECAVEEEDGSERRLPNPLAAGVAAALLEARLASRGLHALAVTGGEPLVQADFLAAVLGTLRPPVPVLLETNGTVPGRLPAVLPFVDIVSMDVKLPSSSGERPFWSEHRTFLEACVGKVVYVKVPVDDGTREDEIAEAAALVGATSPAATVFLQPIVSAEGEPRASAGRLARFYDQMAERVRDVRVLPQTHKLLGVR